MRVISPGDACVLHMSDSYWDERQGIVCMVGRRNVLVRTDIGAIVVSRDNVQIVKAKPGGADDVPR